MHLEKKKNTWYAVLVKPADVWLVLGSKRWYRSTKTGDKVKAQLHASMWVAGWKAEIAKARGTSPSAEDSFWENLRQDFANARVSDSAHEAATGEAGHHAGEVMDVIKAQAAKITDREAASLAYRVATGQAKALASLAPLVVDWKGSLRMAQKTIDQQHRDVKRMADHFGNLDALTPQKIKAWTDKLMGEGVTASSFERIGNGCRSFWLYLQQSGTRPMIDPDPFVGPFRLAQRTAKNNKMGRKGFTADELAKVYAEAVKQGDAPLADLIALGAYTGARIEELCKLTKDTAKDGLFHMGTKTAASVRDCPVHPAVAPLVARMLSASTDGYLVPSTADNQYGNRSGPLSQKFGRLKKGMGFGTEHVFHSTRHTLSTLMEQAGCRKEVIADVVGHEKGNFTLDTYSGGSSMAQKREAIGKVAYPAPLDAP